MSRGTEALAACLDAGCFDLRELDVDGFRSWLQRHVDRWQRDPVFRQRANIRGLRRQFPRVVRLQRELRRAAAADAASPQFARLQRLEKRLSDVGKAIAGLSDAVRDAPPDQRPSLQRKLDAFREEQASLAQEQKRLVEASPERQVLRDLASQLDRVRALSGLAAEETELRRVLRQRGQRSGRSGESFEQSALQAVSDEIVPDLAVAADGDPVTILHGVRLGAARVELDQVIIRRNQDRSRPAEVLAVVEVKRNINDLAHGFRRRQEDLCWLTGQRSRYDPESFRTRDFPRGHFDRPAVHRHQGQELILTTDSFARFRRNEEHSPFIRGLCFVTRCGLLWGISSAGLARLARRVASDRRWDLADDGYLQELLEWSRALTHPFEAPDLLRLYARDEARARQILLLQ